MQGQEPFEHEPYEHKPKLSADICRYCGVRLKKSKARRNRIVKIIFSVFCFAYNFMYATYRDEIRQELNDSFLLQFMLLILPIMIVETLLEQLFTDYEPYTGEEDQESDADEDDSREREIATGGDSQERKPAASGDDSREREVAASEDDSQERKPAAGENDSHKHEPATGTDAQQESERQAMNMSAISQKQNGG